MNKQTQRHNIWVNTLTELLTSGDPNEFTTPKENRFLTGLKQISENHPEWFTTEIVDQLIRRASDGTAYRADRRRTRSVLKFVGFDTLAQHVSDRHLQDLIRTWIRLRTGQGIPDALLGVLQSTALMERLPADSVRQLVRSRSGWVRQAVATNPGTLPEDRFVALTTQKVTEPTCPYVTELLDCHRQSGTASVVSSRRLTDQVTEWSHDPVTQEAVLTSPVGDVAAIGWRTKVGEKIPNQHKPERMSALIQTYVKNWARWTRDVDPSDKTGPHQVMSALTKIDVTHPTLGYIPTSYMLGELSVTEWGNSKPETIAKVLTQAATRLENLEISVNELTEAWDRTLSTLTTVEQWKTASTLRPVFADNQKMWQRAVDFILLCPFSDGSSPEDVLDTVKPGWELQDLFDTAEQLLSEHDPERETVFHSQDQIWNRFLKYLKTGNFRGEKPKNMLDRVIRLLPEHPKFYTREAVLTATQFWSVEDRAHAFPNRVDALTLLQYDPVSAEHYLNAHWPELPVSTVLDTVIRHEPFQTMSLRSVCANLT